MTFKMFAYRYLNKEQLKGLNKYKYSAIDTSPLSQYVMHPTWNTIVKVIPKSIAPNLITFAGFVCMLLAVLLLTVYDYEWYGAGGRYNMKYPSEIPSWVYVTCGLLIFVAYNLDGVDGKQARRIGVSGPLGELFDHGLDSYIVFLIPYAIISIFGRDPEFSTSIIRGFLIVVSVVFNFYISHWEKYTTGTLYLPWGYDVSMWLSSMLFILEGVYGPGYYRVYIFKRYNFINVLEVIIHLVGLLTTLPVAVYNVILSYQKRTGRMHSLLEVFRPLVSFSAVTWAMTFWALNSPNNILNQYPRAFVFLYGTLFSNVASRLIIAEMCHSRCEVINWIFWPLVAGITASLIQSSLEGTILHLLLLLAIASHVHYGVCMVRQICQHLKIQCFTVPKQKRK